MSVMQQHFQCYNLVRYNDKELKTVVVQHSDFASISLSSYIISNSKVSGLGSSRDKD